MQLTPPGSGCSIQIGRGLTDAPVGSLRNVYLVVTDLEAARIRLREHGVDVDEIRHKVPIDAWDGSLAPGLALQLPFFEVGALSDCLVSSTPE